MPWIRNSVGRQHFVSPTQLEKMVLNKDAFTIIEDPTIKEDPRDIAPSDEEQKAKLRAEFKKKYGEDVPTNKKNDVKWMKEKIDQA